MGESAAGERVDEHERCVFIEMKLLPLLESCIGKTGDRIRADDAQRPGVNAGNDRLTSAA